MKKLTYFSILFLASFVLFSCGKNDAVSDDEQLEMIPDDAVKTNVVTIDEAEKEVLAFINAVDPKTKSGEPARKIADRFTSGGFGPTKVDGKEETPLVHVFNFADDKGFAIASGDRRVSPILCVTDKGSLHEGDEIDNPGFLMALSDIDTYYRLSTGLPIIDRNGDVVTPDEYAPKLGFTPEPADPYVPGVEEFTYEYGDWETYSGHGSV